MRVRRSRTGTDTVDAMPRDTSYAAQSRPGRLTGTGTVWRSLAKVPVLVDVAHADGRVTRDVRGRADGFNGGLVCVTYRLDTEQFIRWFPASDVRRAPIVADDNQ